MRARLPEPATAEGGVGVVFHRWVTRRLLQDEEEEEEGGGGGLDLAAEENQVYLFMVLFGIVLFGVPPFLKLLQIVKKMRSDKVQAEDDEMWNFQDEYEDMKNVNDPLEGDENDKKKKKKRRG